MTADPARIEAALRTLHGMVDMGCRKATGLSVEEHVDYMSRQGLVDHPGLFSVFCAIICMKEVLDGETEAHAAGCTIYQHDHFDPANCTCNAKDGR